jgi:hypothetical protein
MPDLKLVDPTNIEELLQTAQALKPEEVIARTRVTVNPYMPVLLKALNEGPQQIGPLSPNATGTEASALDTVTQKLNSAKGALERSALRERHPGYVIRIHKFVRPEDGTGWIHVSVDAKTEENPSEASTTEEPATRTRRGQKIDVS